MTYIYANGELPPKNMKSTVGVGYYGKTIPFFLANKKGEQVAKSIRISFYDTAGQEKYDAITVAHYRKSMGAIVAYSVTDRESFSNVQKWHEQVKEHADPNCAIILLANKCDVTSSARKVSYDEGEALANQLGLKFFEVSALKNKGINEAMESLAQMITKSYEKIST